MKEAISYLGMGIVHIAKEPYLYLFNTLASERDIFNVGPYPFIPNTLEKLSFYDYVVSAARV